MKSIMLIIPVLLLLVSCETEADYQRRLTGTRWQIVSMKSEKAADFNLDGVVTTDLFNDNLPCRLDDIYILNPNKELILDENEEICSYPNQRKGSWYAKARSLMLHPEGRPTTFYEIVSVSDSQMVTTYHHYDGGHYPVEVVFEAVTLVD
ncbi:MAG: hypothetical protein R3B47_20575 [Bacteroidia bacterium]